MYTHRLAQQLGYVALLPFVAAAISAWLPVVVPTPMPVPTAWASQALSVYAAVVASFIGGMHWGLAMRQPQPHGGLYLWGVAPAIVAWLLCLMPTPWQAPGLAALLVACYAVDRRVYPREGLQSWLVLRLHLTVVATLCCVLFAWRPAP
jgi:hypothetical protein